ncbi:MAG: type II toxin-antitoxin system HicB family antitoxin [Chloroflexi bacterium]|nr:type II toxin-antitoxin system HicB family antitoxin [Chloroflexota bacterium]
MLHPEPEDDGYSVIVPALPGCLAQGKTIEETVDLAEDSTCGARGNVQSTVKCPASKDRDCRR